MRSIFTIKTTATGGGTKGLLQNRSDLFCSRPIFMSTEFLWQTKTRLLLRVQLIGPQSSLDRCPISGLDLDDERLAFHTIADYLLPAAGSNGHCGVCRSQAQNGLLIERHRAGRRTRIIKPTTQRTTFPCGTKKRRGRKTWVRCADHIVIDRCPSRATDHSYSLVCGGIRRTRCDYKAQEQQHRPDPPSVPCSNHGSDSLPSLIRPAGSRTDGPGPAHRSHGVR